MSLPTQVLYNLASRGIELDLLPWCVRHGIQVMAYSPLDEGRLVRHPALAPIAARLGASPAQLALAWTMREPAIAAIPKAAREEHVRSNRAAADIVLDAGALVALDRVFPPPRRKSALAMI